MLEGPGVHCGAGLTFASPLERLRGPSMESYAIAKTDAVEKGGVKRPTTKGPDLLEETSKIVDGDPRYPRK